MMIFFYLIYMHYCLLLYDPSCQRPIHLKLCNIGHASMHKCGHETTHKFGHASNKIWIFDTMITLSPMSGASMWALSFAIDTWTHKYSGHDVVTDA